jgi:hypothetical protein
MDQLCARLLLCDNNTAQQLCDRCVTVVRPLCVQQWDVTDCPEGTCNAPIV